MMLTLKKQKKIWFQTFPNQTFSFGTAGTKVLKLQIKNKTYFFKNNKYFKNQSQATQKKYFILKKNFKNSSKKGTSTQTKKSFFDRTENKKTTFGINYTEKDHGKHFLLIDDVITTGGTLEACGKVLTSIPNAKVSVIAMAYSH